MDKEAEKPGPAAIFLPVPAETRRRLFSRANTARAHHIPHHACSIRDLGALSPNDLRTPGPYCVTPGRRGHPMESRALGAQ